MTKRAEGIRPQDLSPEQRFLYDAIVDSPRSKGDRALPLVNSAGILQGPFNSMLLSPGVGLALQELGSQVRYSENLSVLEREVAILTVAAYVGSDYEVRLHSQTARSAGLSEEDVKNICEQGLPPEVSGTGSWFGRSFGSYFQTEHSPMNCGSWPPQPLPWLVSTIWSLSLATIRFLR